MTIQKNWETFLTDASNKTAFKVCKAFSAGNERGPRLLWLYGPSGCGKTHLLKAVARENTHALVISARDATDALLWSLVSTGFAWKRLKRAKLLIIDNAEDWHGKEGTQELLARVIRKKCASGHRVVIASTCPPKALPTLCKAFTDDPKLVRKTRIRPPSEALLTRFALSYLSQMPFEIPPSVLDYLVQNTTSPAAIEGVMKTACFRFQCGKDPLDTEWMRRTLPKRKERK